MEKQYILSKPNQCFKINDNENDKSIELSKEIERSMEYIDDSMSCDDFAKSVAYILVNDYGYHNYKPFINTLLKELSKITIK